jgi:hypothetical protein
MHLPSTDYQQRCQKHKVREITSLINGAGKTGYPHAGYPHKSGF